MCGIAGYLTGALQADVGRGWLLRMADTLQRRGPDSHGYWQSDDAGVGFGHRRLSIIDLSESGSQPMQSACGRYVIAFNGEIYNFRAIRKELDALPNSEAIQFRGHSDTEVLITAISVWGLDEAVGRLNGMFAFALWDRKERSLYLVRDRMGEKPLYYGWIGKVFLFGSELKALAAHPQWQPSIRRESAGEFFRHGYVPGPHSIYEGIFKLPPGHIARVEQRGAPRLPVPRPYWSCREAEAAGRQARGVASGSRLEQLDELVVDAITARMEADVPLGAFLSGGIDSSLVTAVMQKHNPSPVKTFCVGFGEDEFNEAPYARAIAEHLGTEHHELFVSTRDALDIMPDLATLYDEPFADPSAIPTLLVSKLAREHVTVVLSGDGGDELFGGYQRYLGSIAYWRNLGRIPQILSRMTGALLQGMSGPLLRRLLAAMPVSVHRKLHEERFNELGQLLQVCSAEEMYQWIIAIWKKPEDIVTGLRPRSGQGSMLDDGVMGHELLDIMTYADQMKYLPDDIFVKLDRASMAVSLEGRVPLVDHRLVEFAWTVPVSDKVRDGQGKWLLRQLLYKYIPQHLVDRPKKGFALPIDQWLRGDLRDWAESLITPERLQAEGFLDAKTVHDRWNDHLTGRRNWHYQLWNVLAFQGWLNAQHTGL